MKTNILISSAVIFLLTILPISVSAQNNKYLYDEEFNSAGQKISITYYDNSTGERILKKKNTFEYTCEGDLAARVSYVWNSKDNDWDLSAKTNYTYDKEGNMKNIAFLKWNDKKKSWKLDGQQKIKDFTQLSETGKYLTNQ